MTNRLTRQQFAKTSRYHTPFVPVTIGLAPTSGRLDRLIAATSVRWRGDLRRGPEPRIPLADR